MRVKVGDQWFAVEPGQIVVLAEGQGATFVQPIAVELTAKDRENIANMHPDATRYGCFPNGMSTEDMREWLGR